MPTETRRRPRPAPRRRGSLRLAVVVAATAALPACATVHVEGPDGSARVERGLGLLSVRLDPGAGSVVAGTRALGVVRTWDGLTVGYHDGELAALSPDDCRVVVWAREPGEIEALRRLLEERPDVCLMPEGE